MSYLNLIEKAFQIFFNCKQYKYLKNTKVYNPLSRNILFTNSGIAGVYQYFNGIKCEANKMSTTQRCIRISGQHSDIKEIGNSANHMIVFNMLGTFGFYDIDYKNMFFDIIEFLINIGLNSRYMTLTFHSKDSNGKELCNICKDKYQLDSRECDENIWRMNKNDCGDYCIEIMYSYKGKEIEIWNCVFRDSYKLVDSGAGLERISYIIGGYESIYELEEFKSFLDLVGNTSDNILILNMLMCIDAIIDSNITVSNNKRGYVMKKMIRKCMVIINKNNYEIKDLVSYGYKTLKNTEYIIDIFQKELSKYNKSVDYLNKFLNNKTSLNIDDVFYLHDTCGIDINYTIERCRLSSIECPDEDSVNKYIENLNSNKSSSMLTHDKSYLEYVDCSNLILNNNEFKVIHNNNKNGIYNIVTCKTNVMFPKGGDTGDIGEIIINDKYKYNFNKVTKIDNRNVSLSITCKHDVHNISNIEIIRNDIYRKNMNRSHSLLHMVLRKLEEITRSNIYLISSNIYESSFKIKIFSKISILLSKDILQDQIQEIVKNAIWTVETKNSIFDLERFESENIKYIPHIEYDNYVNIVAISNGNNIISKEVCCGNHNEQNISQIKSLNIIDIQQEDAFIHLIEVRLISKTN